jgi:hypothetical protein
MGLFPAFFQNNIKNKNSLKGYASENYQNSTMSSVQWTTRPQRCLNGWLGPAAAAGKELFAILGNLLYFATAPDTLATH